MSEHVHTCVGCIPDMVPEVNLKDRRYQGSQRTGFHFTGWGNPLVNGVETPGVREAFSGPDGWVRVFNTDEQGHRHSCPCGAKEACCTVIYGDVVLRRKAEVFA